MVDKVTDIDESLHGGADGATLFDKTFDGRQKHRSSKHFKMALASPSHLQSSLAGIYAVENKPVVSRKLALRRSASRKSYDSNMSKTSSASHLKYRKVSQQPMAVLSRNSNALLIEQHLTAES